VEYCARKIVFGPGLFIGSLEKLDQGLVNEPKTSGGQGVEVDHKAEVDALQRSQIKKAMSCMKKKIEKKRKIITIIIGVRRG